MFKCDKDDSKEKSTPANPEQCQKFGTAACIGCIFAQNCQDRQAAMMEKNNNLQPEEQLSTLEQLLREDEAPGEIVWAQAVPETDEAGDLGQIEEVLEAASPNVMEAAPDGENVTDSFTRYFETEQLADFIELAARLGLKVWLSPLHANGKPLHVQG